MGQKKPENGLEIAPAEEERAPEENKETSEPSIEQTLREVLSTLREVLDRENVSEAAFDELRDRRGNVVLRGDFRSVVFRGSDVRIVLRGDVPPSHGIVPDLLHRQMRGLSRQYPCVWCAQPAAEQE
jgi:hypothetical protein